MSSDDDKNDDNNTDDKISDQLKSCTSFLEICNWLVDHPHILRLANQMLEMKMKKSFSDESSLDMGNTLPSTEISSTEITNVSIKSI